MTFDSRDCFRVFFVFFCVCKLTPEIILGYVILITKTQSKTQSAIYFVHRFSISINPLPDLYLFQQP